MIITGENSDTISTPENNKLYNQNLKDKISFKGINSIESDIASSFLPYYKVKGKFSGNTEHSFIIYNCSHFDAECLAKSCRQQSFIFGTNDNGKLTFEMWANKSKNDYHYKKQMKKIYIQIDLKQKMIILKFVKISNFLFLLMFLRLLLKK